MGKLEKMADEIARLEKRKTDITARLEDLKEKYKEEEKLEIYDLVKTQDITLDQLGTLIANAKRGVFPSIADSDNADKVEKTDESDSGGMDAFNLEHEASESDDETYTFYKEDLTDE